MDYSIQSSANLGAAHTLNIGQGHLGSILGLQIDYNYGIQSPDEMFPFGLERQMNKAQPFTDYQKILAAACRQLEPEEPKAAKVRRMFTEITTALDFLEAQPPEEFGGPHLAAVIDVLNRNASQEQKLADLPCNLNAFIADRRQELHQLSLPHLNYRRLVCYQRLTKCIWQKCSEENVDKYQFVSRERLQLAAILTLALDTTVNLKPADSAT